MAFESDIITLDTIVRRLERRADAVFVREPAVDPGCPDSSDLDLLVFAGVEELLAERWFESERRPVDLIWLPAPWLDDPEGFAARGVLPHRLLSSRLLFDATSRASERMALVREQMYRPAVQTRRIAGLLEMGFLTVREVGVTRDLPALALFWLHMAFAAALAALADSAGRLCPNVYTRPFDYTDALEEETGIDLRRVFVSALRLTPEPTALAPGLRRLQAIVSSRFPEPAWPEAVRPSTRYEYRYFSSAMELDWRVSAAREMARRGNAPNGTFYLRLLAYALARVPSVHERAREGVHVSFLRPSRAMGGDLRALCPEIVEELALLLGDGASWADVERALDEVVALRARVLELARARRLPLTDVPEWAPHRPEPSTPQQGEAHVQDRPDL